MAVAGTLTTFTGLLGFAMLAGAVAELANGRADSVFLLGFGSAFASLAYGFGRVGLAAFTEIRRRPTAEPGYLPWIVALVSAVAGLAAIPLLP